MTYLNVCTNPLVPAARFSRRLPATAGLFAVAGLLACTSSGSSSISSAVLGTAESFAVLGGSTVTNTGPTTIVGNLGVSPGLAVTGFPPGMVTGGVIHAGDAVALQSQRDVTTAYDTLKGAACDHDMTSQDLGGLTLTPGVYCFSSSAQLTGALTLDAKGNPDSVFIFQIGSTLTTASDASVLVINGARGCNVFWQVGSSATLGTTTKFVGNLLALTSITLTTGAEVSGRALARNGALTMDANHVAAATCAAAGGADAGVRDAGAIDAGGGSAGHGQVCGDLCVDLQGDRENCGSCSHVCAWDAQCVAGKCTCEATTCGTICVELGQNPLNCGACGHVCGADQFCDHGTCSSACAGTICGGWCTDLMTNVDACGACDHPCGPTETCNAGVCVCAGTMCGSTCVDLSTSAGNCGACDHDCGQAGCCGAGQCCTGGSCLLP
jgi:hypothetical protein